MASGQPLSESRLSVEEPNHNGSVPPPQPAAVLAQEFGHVLGTIPQPSPLPDRVQLWLCGRWGQHGVAILSEGKHQATVRLSPALFDLLAVLVLTAIRPVSPDQSWVPSGFMTAEELCRELTRRGGGNPNRPWYTKKYVNRMVYRLRTLLATVLFQSRCQGREWADRFLENGPLGYRVSSAMANLRLAILDGPGGREDTEKNVPTVGSKGPDRDQPGIDGGAAKP